MTAAPLVSVVIPAYNRAHCIGRAIRSAARQSHPAIEIIVVDDGSTDDTARVVAGIECGRPLRFEPLGRNQGANAARNRGIEVAEGRYVAFLDSDDAWHPAKIERQLAALEAAGPGHGAVYTGIVSLTEEGRLGGISRATESGDLRRALLHHNLVGSTSCTLAERALLRAAGGFRPGLRSCQDWELWIRLAERTRFACVPEALTTLYLAGSGRITTGGRGRLSGHLYVYRTHLRRAFRDGTTDPALFVATLAEIFMQLGRPGYARRLLARNWRAKPLSAKRLLLLLAARLELGPAAYLRTVDWLRRIEERLRPSPIRPPADLASAAR